MQIKGIWWRKTFWLSLLLIQTIQTLLNCMFLLDILHEKVVLQSNQFLLLKNVLVYFFFNFAIFKYSLQLSASILKWRLFNFKYLFACPDCATIARNQFDNLKWVVKFWLQYKYLRRLFGFGMVPVVECFWRWYNLMQLLEFFLLWFKYKISGFITILPNIVYACLFASLSIVKQSSQELTIFLLRWLKGKKEKTLRKNGRK